MIDKELIRQAAEDIDLFGDDLSAEFDRLSQQRTRTGNVSSTFANEQNVGLRGLWPYMAAACIALLLAVGITVRLLTNNANGSGSLASGHVNTTKDTASVHDRNLAQASPTPEGEKDGEGQQAILPPQPTSFDFGQNAERKTTRKLAKMQTNHLTSCILTKVKSRGLGGLKAEEVPQEEDAYSEALLYALITEVEAKAMAEQAEEERLYRTLLEEISTNISKETTQTELTL